MPKLFEINININRGSVGKITEQIGLLAQKKGWEVEVAYGWAISTPSELHTYRIESNLGIKWHAIMTRIFDRHGLHSTIATQRLIDQIIKFAPDVIQIHNIHGYFINYRVLFEFLKSYNKPVVWTLHDCWAMTGHCSHFVTAKCDKWKTECNDCPLKRDYPTSYLFDRSRKNYIEKKHCFSQLSDLHIVTVSHWLANIVNQSFLRYAPVQVVHNGIDLNSFLPCKEKDAKTFNILCISNVWVKSKGLADIFRLRELLPLDKYKITMIGLTMEQIDKLPEGICGLTRTENQRELAEFYSSSNVLINPTYADSFPTINLESLACGTPVITYNTGGSPETIDEKTGVVVEPGDIDSLVNAVYSIQSKNIPVSVCRERALNLFNKDICFNNYISIYESVLK